MKNQKGFTLIELMITLVVMGILLTNVVGMAASYVSSANLRATAEEFRSGLMAAKVEAVKRNSAIVFTQNSNGGWGIAIPANYSDSGTVENLQSKSLSTSILAVSAVDSLGTAVTSLRFVGSGRPSMDIANPPNYPVTYSFTVANKSCTEVTCLNVIVASGGQIKICNPNAAGVYSCS